MRVNSPTMGVPRVSRHIALVLRKQRLICQDHLKPRVRRWRCDAWKQSITIRRAPRGHLPSLPLCARWRN